MSPIAVVLLAAAIVIVAACEWPRLRSRLGIPKRPARAAKRRSKANLRVFILQGGNQRSKGTGRNGGVDLSQGM